MITGGGGGIGKATAVLGEEIDTRVGPATTTLPIVKPCATHRRPASPVHGENEVGSLVTMTTLPRSDQDEGIECATGGRRPLRRIRQDTAMGIGRATEEDGNRQEDA